MNEFDTFLEEYLTGWRNCSLEVIKLSTWEDFQAREVREIDGEILVQDYGYAESIKGWKEAFDAFQDKEVKWAFHEVNRMPLRQGEILISFWVTLELDGVKVQSAHYFTDTFKQMNGDWKLIRSYIEASVPISSVPKERIQS